MSLAPNEIVTHLQKYLPAVSDKFSNSISVTSAVVSTITEIAQFNQFLNVSSQAVAPTGMAWSPDGLRLYILDNATKNIYQFDVSVAWNVATGVFLQSTSLGFTSTILGVFMRPDGTSMYILESRGFVSGYDLSTAWDIATLVLKTSYEISFDSNTADLFFKPDGLKLYIIESENDRIAEFDVTTAWDLSTATLVTTFSLANEDTVPTGLFFRPDGLGFYTTGTQNNSVYEYTLTTAWDISTSAFISSLDITTQGSAPNAVFASTDETKLFVLARTEDEIYQYDIIPTSINVVTVVATSHGLSVDDQIVVSNAQFENLLASVLDNGDGTVRFGTDQEHDLTEAQLPDDPTTVTLASFGTVWDGTFDIVSVPNRQFFEIAFPSGETDLPTLGTGVLIETRAAGLIGNQTIATVANDGDTFTFQATTVPSLPTGDILDFSAAGTLRIYGAADFNRATELYNQLNQDEYALFVIMGDVTVSKDRHTANDSIGSFTAQDLLRQTVLNDFSTVVFMPTKDDVGGNDAQQAAYGEIYTALLRVLYGFTFEDEETALSYATVSRGHGAGLYNTAYYVHVYDWQRPDVITYTQGFDFGPEVAFRNIEAEFKNFNDEEAVLDANVNLDDEPI